MSNSNSRQARSSSNVTRVSRKQVEIFSDVKLDESSFTHRFVISAKPSNGNGKGILVYGSDSSKNNDAWSERLLTGSRDGDTPFFAGYPAVIDIKKKKGWESFEYSSFAGYLVGQILKELANTNSLPDGITLKDLNNLKALFLDEEGNADSSLKGKNIVKVQTVANFDAFYLNGIKLNRSYASFMNVIKKQEQGYLLSFEILFNNFLKSLKYNEEYKCYTLRLSDAVINLIYGPMPTVDLTGVKLVKAERKPDGVNASKKAFNGLQKYEDVAKPRTSKLSTEPKVDLNLDIEVEGSSLEGTLD